MATTPTILKRRVIRFGDLLHSVRPVLFLIGMQLFDAKRELLATRNVSFSTTTPCVCEQTGCRCECSDSGGVKCVTNDGAHFVNPNLFGVKKSSSDIFSSFGSFFSSALSLPFNLFKGISGLFGGAWTYVQYVFYFMIFLFVFWLFNQCGGANMIQKLFKKGNSQKFNWSDIKTKFGVRKSQLQEKAKEKLNEKRDKIKEKTKSTKKKLTEKRDEVKEKAKSAKEKVAKKLGQNENKRKDKFSVKGNQKDEQNIKNNASKKEFRDKNRTTKGINLGADSKHDKRSPAISERVTSSCPEKLMVSSNKKSLSLSLAKSKASSFSPQERKPSSVTSRIRRSPSPTRVEKKAIVSSAAQKKSSSSSEQNRAKSASPNRPKSGSSSARRRRSVPSTSTSKQKGRSAFHSTK